MCPSVRQKARQPTNPPKRSGGFTLLEAMITLLILSIILLFAVPSFTSQMRNNQSLTFGDEFVTALNYARSEAVKRGRLVSICPSNDDVDDCGNDWTNGWLVVLDSADETDGTVDLDDTDDILRVWEEAGEDMSLTVERDDNDVTFLRFTGMGQLAIRDDGEANIDARHDDCDGDASREIRVLVSGSIGNRRAECD